MSLHLTIDPEFANKIPPLREEELEQLEENILADGVVINPLIIWDGEIVDGHNRYRILQKHPEIQFTTYEKKFTDRYAAIAKAPPEERPALVQQLRQAKETEKQEEKPKPRRSAAETLQAIRDISADMLQSNGEIDADDICAELEDALDTMIFRWDTCLENYREHRSACRDGIKSL